MKEELERARAIDMHHATKAGCGRFDRVEQQELALIFKDLVFLEREVETAKIEVALKADFNLMDAFRLFDTMGRGFITQRDFAEGLRASL